MRLGTPPDERDSRLERDAEAIAKALGLGLFAIGAITAAGLYFALLQSLPTPKKDPKTGGEYYDYATLPDWARAIPFTALYAWGIKDAVRTPIVRRAAAKVATGIGIRAGGKAGVHAGAAALKAGSAASVVGLVVTVAMVAWDAGRWGWDVSNGKAKMDAVEFFKYQIGIDQGSTPILSALGL